MANRTILFSTFGSHRQGAGHLMRDIELAVTLQEHADIIFHVHKSSFMKKMLAERGFSDIFDGSLNIAIKRRRPDAVIYDKPYSLGPIERMPSSYKPRVFALDYFFYDDSRVDIAINIKNHHFPPLKKSISRIYEGTAYAIIRDEILQRRNSRLISRRPKNILVTFGGADPKNNTQKAIDILNNIESENLNIRIILGAFFRKGLKYSSAKNIHSCEIIKKTAEMGVLMAWADLAFSGAGTTIMELLCLGCPAVVMPQSKEELDFALDLRRKKALLLLNSLSNYTAMKKTVLDFLHNRQQRVDFSRNGKKVFDGKGKERIKNIILNSL